MKQLINLRVFKGTKEIEVLTIEVSSIEEIDSFCEAKLKELSPSGRRTHAILFTFEGGVYQREPKKS